MDSSSFVIKMSPLEDNISFNILIDEMIPLYNVYNVNLMLKIQSVLFKADKTPGNYLDRK